MCVRVDKTGKQQVVRPADERPGLVFFTRFGKWQQISHTAVIDDHGMLGKDYVGRFNRGAPTRRNQGIAMLHSRGSIRVAPGTSSRV